jgi:hypothetical protein
MVTSLIAADPVRSLEDGTMRARTQRGSDERRHRACAVAPDCVGDRAWAIRPATAVSGATLAAR